MPKALWKIINYNYHNHHNIDVPIRRTKIFYAEELSPPSIKLINNSKNSSSHSASLPNNSANANHASHFHQNNQVSKNNQNNKASSPWEQLPIEILVFIFSHLSIKEIRQLTLICKKWQLVASSEHFWRTLHQIHFGGAKFDGRSWRFHCLFAYKEFKTIKKTGFFPGEENSANFMIDTIEHGANSLFRVINSENQIIHLPRWIYSSWMWAAERGHYQVLNSLYTDHSLVPSLEIRDLATRRTALYRAVQSSNIETIKWLLSVGAQVDARRDDEATPLFYAAGKGNLEVVKILVQNGADLNSTDRAGGSPLIMACQNRLLDVIHYLLPRCDVNQPLRDGETPLYVASMLGYCDVIDILLSYNADVNKARYNGATPFWIASKQGHLEALRRLAAVPGINTDIYVQGISCLEIALRKSHLHVAKFLIQLRQHDNHPQDYNNPRNLIETRPTLHVARSVSVM